jgi:hemerythrin-like domain-containing protein
MPVRIGDANQAGFDNPLQMLTDCHRRIELFLAGLVKLAHTRAGAPLEAGERLSLAKALDYFQTSGARHTSDEEESLFPRMRHCSEAAEALGRIEALHSDHEIADRSHAEVDALGRRWLNTGSLSGEDAARMETLLDSLATLYAKHIEMEDRDVFPIAGRTLAPEDIAKIGEEMARRRGLA